jgi:hypothetical protein
MQPVIQIDVCVHSWSFLARDVDVENGMDANLTQSYLLVYQHVKI